MHISSEIENVTKYTVIDYKKHLQHTVNYDSSNGVVTYSCKKFEFSGILYSDALKVLSSRNIKKIKLKLTLEGSRSNLGGYK